MVGCGSTQADRLVGMVEDAELFHAPDGKRLRRFYCQWGVARPGRSAATGFKDLLHATRYFEANGAAPPMPRHCRRARGRHSGLAPDTMGRSVTVHVSRRRTGASISIWTWEMMDWRAVEINRERLGAS